MKYENNQKYSLFKKPWLFQAKEKMTYKLPEYQVPLFLKNVKLTTYQRFTVISLVSLGFMAYSLDLLR
ncbi:hypothetical protein pb186bvf_013201 [Paramecium bursaria]